MIHKAYEALRPATERCNWDTFVWGRSVISNHKLAWLAMNNRLGNKDRIQKYRICTDSSWLLCGVDTENENLAQSLRHSLTAFKIEMLGNGGTVGLAVQELRLIESAVRCQETGVKIQKKPLPSLCHRNDLSNLAS